MMSKSSASKNESAGTKIDASKCRTYENINKVIIGNDIDRATNKSNYF
jgi:hypothetical protein